MPPSKVSASSTSISAAMAPEESVLSEEPSDQNSSHRHLSHSHAQDEPFQDSPVLVEGTHDHSHHDHSGHGDHVHSEESQKRIINRLSRVEGHIRGVKSMVQRGEDCPDVLIQIAAVRGALDRIARMILDEHLTQCIVRAAAEGNVETELEELKTALDRFLPRDKPTAKKQD